MGALISIVAILAWAAISISKNHSKGGGDSKRLIKALADQLDDATAERDRLKRRVENLEAIVTGDSYALDVDAQLASVSRIDPLLLDDERSDDEREAEHLAKRIRER